MNRLYVVEGGYTSTGAAADSRLALRPGQMKAFLAELARRVDELSGGASHDHSDETEAFDELAPGQRLERFLDVLAHDIAEAGEKAVVVVGEHLGADAVAAGIRMNGCRSEPPASIRHTRWLLSEDLNLSQKLLRMRARTKVLLCRTFEEAWSFFCAY